MLAPTATPAPTETAALFFVLPRSLRIVQQVSLAAATNRTTTSFRQQQQQQPEQGQQQSLSCHNCVPQSSWPFSQLACCKVNCVNCEWATKVAAIVAGTESNHIHQQLVPQTQTQTQTQTRAQTPPQSSESSCQLRLCGILIAIQVLIEATIGANCCTLKLSLAA